MNKTFRTMLFATALFPVAAFAQDANTTTTPGQNQDQQPAVVNPDANSTNATQGTDATGGNSATSAQSTDMQQNNTGTAQTTTTTGTSTDMAATGTGGETFVTVPPTGAWRVADLVGKDVYGADNEDIGEINDVIVGQDGRVLAVIVGVGGFLGIGEKNVAVSMTALEFGPGMTPSEAQAASAASGNADQNKTDMNQAANETGAVATGTDTTGTAATGGAASTDAAGTQDQMAANTGDNDAKDVEIGSDALPDHIVLRVTKQQLEDAPAFEGIRGPNNQGDMNDNDNNAGTTNQQ